MHEFFTVFVKNTISTALGVFGIVSIYSAILSFIFISNKYPTRKKMQIEESMREDFDLILDYNMIKFHIVLFIIILTSILLTLLQLIDIGIVKTIIFYTFEALDIFSNLLIYFLPFAMMFNINVSIKLMHLLMSEIITRDDIIHRKFILAMMPMPRFFRKKPDEF